MTIVSLDKRFPFYISCFDDSHCIPNKCDNECAGDYGFHADYQQNHDCRVGEALIPDPNQPGLRCILINSHSILMLGHRKDTRKILCLFYIAPKNKYLYYTSSNDGKNVMNIGKPTHL